jgi:hypothetical protein
MHAEWKSGILFVVMLAVYNSPAVLFSSVAQANVAHHASKVANLSASELLLLHSDSSM